MFHKPPMFSSSIPALVVLAAASLSLASCTNVRANETRNLTAAHIAGSAIKITTGNGRIQLIGGSGAKEVTVQATITAVGATTIEAEERLRQVVLNCTRGDDQVLVIDAEFPGRRRGSEGVSFRVSVPDASGAILKTSNGSITVKSIGGQLVCGTSNGRISVDNHEGPVDLSTSNGGIKVVKLAGTAKVRTSNGGVNVELERDQEGPVDIRTSNGHIGLVVGSAFRGSLKMSTSNGRVKLHNRTQIAVDSHCGKRSGVVNFGEGSGSRLVSSNGGVTVTLED
jgi:DUF4097 and DUF4098 domain-containing protein YvlB